jgi:hypothetical protein
MLFKDEGCSCLVGSLLCRKDGGNRRSKREGWVYIGKGLVPGSVKGQV